ncbi:MAG: 2-dehydropantoate 2-reductase [Polyangiales bacterium]
MTDERQHIGVIGAGAVGCYVGGRLAANAAADVTLVGRQWLADAVLEHGMTLRELDHDELLAAEDIRFVVDPREVASCDVVLCCVKSGATASTAAQLAGILHPAAIVVSLQNGLRNGETLRAHLPQNHVVDAIVDFNVIMRDHAVFQRTTSGPLTVETKHGARHQLWVNALRVAGLEVVEVDAIEPEQWTKLLVNLNNAINALAGVPTREMILSRQYRKVIAMLLDEGLDVLDEASVRPAKFRGVPLRVMSFILKLPTPLVRLVIAAQLRMDPDARTSMAQDLERRRLTEVDFLNGEIVNLAESNSRDAPLNRRIVELIHEAERAGAGSPRFDAETLLQRLRS